MARSYKYVFHDLEIKKCPFCGNDPKLVTRNKTIVGGELRHNCYVICSNCDSRGKRFLEDDIYEPYEARESAVVWWNKRV